jgi:DNA-binding protein YbaB
MLDKIKQIYELQQKAQAVKRELENSFAEVGSEIKITISGSQKIQKLEITDDLLADKGKLQARLIDALNDAIRKSQELAAQKMKEITGINLPNL